MDTIVASLVGATATILVAIFGYLRIREERRRVEKAQQATDSLQRETTATGALIRDELLLRYGFKMESVKDLVELIDLDGSCQVTKSHQGVQVVLGNTTIGQIRRSLSGSGVITQLPQLQPLSYGKAVQIAVNGQDAHQCDFQIEITPALALGDPPLDYSHVYKVSNAFVMTREEAVEAYRNDPFKLEYHTLHVDFPIDSLEIEIVFPEGYAVDTFPGVFFGNSEEIHLLELGRVKGGFERGARGATLKVRGPLVGFRYLIFWDPLPREAVDALRSRN